MATLIRIRHKIFSFFVSSASSRYANRIFNIIKMSVREEEQRKNNCPSRGLGLAAAAIGVGVGAALYYFFSKRNEHPDAEGSTSEGWRCQQPQALNASEDEYTTISENSTSDTSILDDSFVCSLCNDVSVTTTDSSFEDFAMTLDSSEYNADDSEEISSQSEDDTDGVIEVSDTERSDSSHFENSIDGWDITDSSFGIPNIITPRSSPLHSIIGRLTTVFDNQMRKAEEPQINRTQAFRERSWSLEECSICFEIMLKNQELMTLPCTHNFHVACIGPWLQEQQTCPMCRKAAE